MSEVLSQLESIARGTVLVLLDFCWQSGLLIGVVFVGMRVLRVRGASVRHFLLVCALFGLGVLPLASSLWPGVGVSRRSLRTVPEEGSRVVRRIERAVFRQREDNAGQVRVGEDRVKDETRTAVSSEAEGASDMGTRTRRSTRVSREPWFQRMARYVGRHGYGLVFGAWMIGVLVGLVRLLREYGAFRRMKASCRAVGDASVLAAYEEALTVVSLRRRPRLLASDGIPAPMAVGILHPVVLVPDTLGETLSFEKLRMVLLHELLHVKRHDLLVGLYQQLLEVVWFFHPLIRHLNRRISQVCEDRCDGLVLVCIGAPKTYAKALMELLQDARYRRVSLSVAAGLYCRSGLATRIRGILDGIPVGSLPRWGISASVAVTCVVVGLLSSVTVLRGPGASTISERIISSKISHGELDVARLPGGAGISGTVRDTSGVPVPGVRVTLVGVRTPDGGYERVRNGPRTETDGEGRYVLTDLRTEVYRLLLFSERFGSYGELKNVASGRQDADVVLGLKSGVSGRITDLLGIPLPGAQVCDRWCHKPAVTADSSGYYRLEGFRFDSIVVEAKGYVTKRVEVRPEYGRVMEGIDVRLEPGGVSISGVVQDAHGVSVIDAEVKIYSDPRSIGGNQFDVVVREEGGRFWIEGLTDDPYDLVVRARGFAPAYVSSVTGGGQDLRIVLDEGGAIEGIVRARSSEEAGVQDLSGLLVEARHVTKSFPRSNARTDGEGRYRIGHLCPGTYRIRVVPGESNVVGRHWVSNAEPVVSVKQGEVVSDVDLLLTLGSSVSGRIVYRDAHTPAARIRVGLIGRGDIRASTDEEGRYRFEGVAQGRYILRSYARGYVESPYASRVEVQQGRSAEDLDLELVRAGTLIVRVADKEGQPVWDAAVRSNGVLFSPEVRTDQHGVCRLAGIRPEVPVSVFVNLPGYAPAWVDSVILVPGEDREIRVQVSFGRVVEGCVVDRAGVPVEDVRVVFAPDIPQFSSLAARFFRREVRTNASGYFRGEHLPYRVHVFVLDDHDRFAPTMQTVSGEDRCDLSVGPGGTVEGRVSDGAGRPAAGVSVYFEPWFCQSNTIVTDSVGRFRAEHVRPGTCSIRVGIDLRDLMGENTEFTVMEDSTTVVEIGSL